MDESLVASGDHNPTPTTAAATSAPQSQYRAATDTGAAADDATMLSPRSRAQKLQQLAVPPPEAARADDDYDDDDETGGGANETILPTQELSCITIYFKRSGLKLWRLVRELNYVIVLMTWTACICLIFAGIICGFAPPNKDGSAVSFLDALFLSVSAFTASGLNTINYHEWNSGGFFFMGFMITMGSIVLLTTLPAVLRYRSLSKERVKLLEVLEQTGCYSNNSPNETSVNSGSNNAANAVDGVDMKPRAEAAPLDADGSGSPPLSPTEAASGNPSPRSASAASAGSGGGAMRGNVSDRVSSILYSSSPVLSPDANSSFDGAAASGEEYKPVAAVPAATATSSSSSSATAAAAASLSTDSGKRMVYEDGLAHINQQMDICCFIVGGAVFYWMFVHVIFTLLLVAGGQTFSWSLFHVVSGFNNAGFATDPDSLVPLTGSGPLANYNLFVLSCCMPLGNSLFPLMFRIVLHCVHAVLQLLTENKAGEPRYLLGQPILVWAHSLRVLLRTPRRYYTHLFSWRTTLLLFGMWFFLTTLGVLLLIPELECDACLDPNATDSNKFFIGLAQSVSIRATGFNTVYLDRVSVGHLAWWVFAMYISAYPFLLAVRSSSIAIKRQKAAAAERRKRHDGDDHQGDEEDEDEENVHGDEEADAQLYQVQQQAQGGQKEHVVTGSFVRREATNVFARDMFCLYAALTMIMYLEQFHGSDLASAMEGTGGNQTAGSDVGISMSGLYLRTAFEITSSFGNVGLTLGVASDKCLTGSFKSGLSVFIMIAIMYFGKHRGLPQSVDDAITFQSPSFDLSDMDAPAVGDKMPAEKLKNIAFRYYSYYNPIRLSKLDEILAAFQSRPESLVKNLELTYGPAPPEKILRKKKYQELFQKIEKKP